VDILTISSSVGQGGLNNPADVRVVQGLLVKKVAPTLHVDGICGPRTINAIKEFQRSFLSVPDGLVDPDGTTIVRLGGQRRSQIALVLLPQTCGCGYYSYSELEKQYGTTATIETVTSVCRSMMSKYPQYPIGVGDVSYVDGRDFPPHKSHRRGTDVDIRPLRKDGKRLPVSISSESYSREHTKALVETMRGHLNVGTIIFNDASIPGVTSWSGHDNHLHIKMKQ
jgi:hypothetical protein